MPSGGATSGDRPSGRPTGAARARAGRPGPNGEAVPVAVSWDERQRRPVAFVWRRRRYQVERVNSALEIWRFNHKSRRIPPGKLLRVELLAPALIHWSADGWRTVQDVRTTDSGLGIHFADLPTDQLSAGHIIAFTMLWLEASRWEGTDFEVEVCGEEASIL